MMTPFDQARQQAIVAYNRAFNEAYARARIPYNRRNTKVDKDGNVFLHGNQIYRGKDGAISFHGWDSRTTYRRLNQILENEDVDSRVYQIEGRPHVETPDGYVMRIEYTGWWNPITGSRC